MSRLDKRVSKLEGTSSMAREPLIVFRRIVAAADGKPTGKEWFASAKTIGAVPVPIKPQTGETDTAFVERAMAERGAAA